MRQLLSLSSIVFGLACLLAAGCGGSGYNAPKGVIVTGKILKGGKPLEVPRRDVGLGNVEVRLIAIDQQSQANRGAEMASANESGVFKFVGPGQGVAPGKYRLAIFQQTQGMGSDALQGAFNETKSPVEIEVPQNKLGGTLDVGVIELDDAGKKKP